MQVTSVDFHLVWAHFALLICCPLTQEDQGFLRNLLKVRSLFQNPNQNSWDDEKASS